MAEVRVEFQYGSYPAIVEEGLAGRIPEVLLRVAPAQRYFFVTDTNIFSHWPNVFPRDDARFATPLALSSGESTKSLDTVASIWTFLLENGVERGHVVVGVGGGVVGDMTGFAAATVLRGIRLVHVPTTLLAQVDASIGGKTGINHLLGKNLIGAFHQPVAVLIDPAFLRTLTDIEFQSGMYEVVKYALIERNGLYQQLSAIKWDRSADMSSVIQTCVRCKAGIVASDEKEAGQRMILNFGHTLGHAIESATQFQKFTHGQAVGWGMLFAIELAETMGLCNRAAGVAVRDLVLKNGELPPFDCPANALMDAMRHDKKVRDGKFTFVLPVDVGEVVVRAGIPAALVQARLEEFLS